MTSLSEFPDVLVTHKELTKKYDDLYFWKNSYTLKGKEAIDTIVKMMEEYKSLFVSSIDGYTLMPQIYYPDDVDFLKRIINNNKKEYIISEPDKVYLQYRLIVYNNKIIVGCLYKREGISLLSKLYQDDIEYLNIIFKEKFLSKWKPDYPLYSTDIFYVEGMKGYKISSIDDIRKVDMYKIDMNKVTDIITGKLPETKGKKKK